MAENRNVTWNIKLKIGPGVTTRFPLNLNSQSIPWGKFGTNPSSQLVVPSDKTEASFSFKAMGRECSDSGTEGTVVYHSIDNPSSPTVFTITWDIPMHNANSGNITMNSQTNYYEIDNGGGVPSTGKSVTVNVVITQIGPTI